MISTIRCLLVVVFFLKNVSYAVGGDGMVNKNVPPYYDDEYINSLRVPIIIPGDYALAISKAYSDFSRKFRGHSDESYSVAFVEVESCYYVQIFMRTTKMSTAVPYSYCVDKGSFQVNYLPDDEAVREIFKEQ